MVDVRSKTLLLGSLFWLILTGYGRRGSLLLLGVLKIELFVLDQVELTADQEFFLFGATLGVGFALLF